MVEFVANMSSRILHDKGTCIIISYDNGDRYYLGGLVDSVGTEISVDDINLPADVLDSWKRKVSDKIDKDNALDYLDKPENRRSKVLTEICQKKVSLS